MFLFWWGLLGVTPMGLPPKDKNLGLSKPYISSPYGVIVRLLNLYLRGPGFGSQLDPGLIVLEVSRKADNFAV